MSASATRDAAYTGLVCIKAEDRAREGYLDDRKCAPSSSGGDLLFSDR
jgi:hypothetical protein